MKKVGQSFIPLAVVASLLCLAGAAFADDNPPGSPGYTQLKPDPPGLQRTLPALPPGGKQVFSPDREDGSHWFPFPPRSEDMSLLAEPPARVALMSEYWIGVQCEDVVPALRSHLNLTEREGMLVEAVMPESPAAKSGVERYDVILAINGKPVGTLAEIVGLVDEAKDAEMTISAIRKGKPIELKITPEKRPESVALPTGPPQQGFFRFEPGPGVVQEWTPDQPQQDIPDDLRRMIEQLREQMEEQMKNLPESGRFRIESMPGGGFGNGFGGMQVFGGPGAGANTLQITIEPARDDAEATLTVRKNGQTWSVSQFSDLPESVQNDVAEVLKNTVDGKDVAEWIAEQLKSNRRMTFSVTVNE